MHSPSHEELKREVEHSLGILSLMELLGIIPRLEESIPHGEGSCLISSEIVKVESGSGKGVLDVIGDLPLDTLGVRAHVGAHEGPHLLGTLLALVVSKFRLKMDDLRKLLLTL